MNNRRLLGEHANGTTANILGGAVFLITLVLGGITLYDLL